ncbi:MULTISPECIES: hypothetical protein [Dehalobacter]|uniref:Uncharacterized protein n=2 Tax=Dehalobacter restrictus TaxID=55583 RepID=A0A857DKS8_9FIRM|nr:MULTISPECIES: hypothetical protein [Dehalobacter]AHF10911.1 hypothetical protein DEHRE_13245 [Dehalobacter restrictus DSM 9455]OCZ49677.1 hypothetical protein A7D23_02265 [Dehalobacter sp. TeCB1]QHA01557.1 hypothetical protein GQ588_13365 [Dehalobacter restrictus]
MRPPYDGPGPGTYSMMPDYHQTMMQVELAVRHGMREVGTVNVRHGVMETALVAYLLGKGFDYYQAVRIVESWERNETFPM